MLAFLKSNLPSRLDIVILSSNGDFVNYGTYVTTISDYDVIDKVTNESVKAYVDITTIEGIVKINKRPITIKPKDVSKNHPDGEPLTSNEYEIVSGSLPDNHWLFITTNGSATETGTFDNYIVDWHILNSDLVDVRDNFEVTREKGKLSIDAYTMTIKPLSKKVVYSGQDVLPDTSRVKITTDYPEEYTVTFELAYEGNYVTIRDAGDSAYAYVLVDTIVVKDALGNDITNQFEFDTSQKGLYQITKRTIKIKPKDLSVGFTGYSYHLDSNSEYEIVGSILCDGDEIVEVRFDETIEITNPGSVATKILGIIILDSDGVNVTTKNYDVKFVDGKITVTE